MNESTQTILKDRQLARDKADWPLEKILNRKLQTAVRADKLQYRLSRLEKATWKDTTFIWKTRMPQNLRIKDNNGLPASSKDRANILADHLQDNQWAKTELPSDPRISYGDNPLSQVPEINARTAPSRSSMRQ